MFETARRSEIRLLAAALLVLTTMLVGLAHRAPVLAPEGALPAEAVSAGFEASAICRHDGPASVEGTAPPLPMVAICDACLLSGAPGLGMIAAIVLPTPPPGDRPLPVFVEAPVRRAALPRPVSRGPPGGIG
jgi:hypothetical protein